ncbi:MAG: hypothetical protein DI539_01020 [Flavobacterium psychrophilum]|nr:MAG: hypothetical protein DI539_01020 [Flavobacterium psychrophilum]
MNFGKKLLYLLLALLLFADIAYSCYQYSKSTIDGDFPALVLGVSPYDKVLEDPLGFSALAGEKYAATNRFTAHAVMSGYFKTVPFILQSVVSPIESVHLSIVIAKLTIHILLLFLLSYYVSGWINFKWKYILIAAILITPLFQTEEKFITYLPLIDIAITYTMFYALPMAALLIFYLPYYNHFVKGNDMVSSKLFITGWIFFALLLSFFGPLTAPVIILSNIIIFPYLLWKNFDNYDKSNFIVRLWNSINKINKSVLITLLSAGFFSLYSMHIGTNNSENGEPTPLSERYSLLLKGIKKVFFSVGSGVPYILVSAIICTVVVYILYKKEYPKYFQILVFLLIFSILYILLLPLGGYRFYRPLILRRDTLTPVLCIIFFCWSASTMILLLRLAGLKKIFPVALASVLIVFYTKKDINLHENPKLACEIETMKKVAASKEDCILLERNCELTRWSFNTDCKESENSAMLLEYYNIIPRKIYFHYPEE